MAEVVARAIVLSTGVAYHKLENESLDKYTGAGVYYGAATTEAVAFKGKAVYIVGGGNSAGQGAMYLSRTAARGIHLRPTARSVRNNVAIPDRPD